MRKSQKRCDYCQKLYTPDPRTAAHQKSCSSPECRKERKKRADQSWRMRFPNHPRDRRNKIRAWARTYPDYWRRYRATHPDYVQNDNKRRRRARKIAASAAKQDAIRQIAVGKLRDIQAMAPDGAAKQDAITRRTVALLDFLLWKESAAKRDVTDAQAYAG
jgi:hypothetical protein